MKDGVKKKAFDIVAEHVTFLGGGKGKDDAEPAAPPAAVKSDDNVPF